MKNFFKFVGVITILTILLFFNASCTMIVYEYGIWALLTSLQVLPPALGYNFFLMLSAVLSYIYIGKTKDKIDLTTPEGWNEVLSNIFTKLCIVGIVFLLNIIVF